MCIRDSTPSEPTVANSVLTQHFLIYYVLILLVVWGPTLLVHRLANVDGKKMIMSGLWVLTLLFFEMLLSWFSVLGTFGCSPVPCGPLSSAYIAFPYDTAIMAVVAFIIYVWAIQSGYRTKDLAEVETLMLQEEGASSGMGGMSSSSSPSVAAQPVSGDTS